MKRAILIILIVALPLISAAAPSGTVVKLGEGSSVGKTAEKRKAGPIYRKGIVRGVVEIYDKKAGYFTVDPLNKGHSTTVYLDPATTYRLDKWRGKKKDLKQGGLVAVRYFGKDYLFIAEEVCIVTTKFDRDHCKRPLPKKTVKKPEDE